MANEKELTAEELQKLYGGQCFYDKVERCSTYIPISGELTEYQILFLHEYHNESIENSSTWTGNAAARPLKLRAALMCLDCETLFPKGIGCTCPVCGGAATWAIASWIPAMEGVRVVTPLGWRLTREVA